MDLIWQISKSYIAWGLQTGKLKKNESFLLLLFLNFVLRLKYELIGEVRNIAKDLERIGRLRRRVVQVSGK